MYIRRISRTNKDGSVVTYVQLAHNVWDSKVKQARARVLFSFGREDQLDLDALRRLITAVARYLGPEETLQVQARFSGESPLEFISSRTFGGSWVLDQIWKELKLDKVLGRLLQKRHYTLPVERAVFAMVANRALAPMSKFAAAEWATSETWMNGVEKIDPQHLYRAMDFLVEAREDIEKEVYHQAADLLNLEVDLLYFDTTSTYFEVDDPDEFRRQGHSKDKRPDLTQVVLGLAVTRDGIPVRCWVWPGNTNDMTVIEEVKRDLVGWKLGRVITVVDRGFCSEENLKTLQRAGGHYIVGEKLRSGEADTEEALARAGRFKTVRDNLEVKEIIVGDGEKRVRYVLVRNPREAERDREMREEVLRRVKEELGKIGDLKGEPHTKACCALITHPSLGRYIKTDRRGQPRLDMDKIKAEEKLDGKYLLSTSDDTISAEDVALGYKQLHEVEDAFRTLKTTLSLRPVYHRLEDRIRAHVLICWLALLLVRIASLRSGQTWNKTRRMLELIHVGEFGSKDGRVLQRTETTPDQARLLKALKVKEPPRFLAFIPGSPPKTSQV
jgi:transposase